MRFAITIFLGAFLLFQVQPLFGKFLLPYFGGTPAVWTTCMLFFQVLLVAGYGYGHFLVALAPRKQAVVHGVVIALAVLVILGCAALWGRPLLPSGEGLSGEAQAPVAGILGILGTGVGLPYLVLSTTGPLIQAWFSRVYPGRSPYRLYALSNLGSLLGLLTYPLAVEPAFALPGQAWLWGGGFLAYAGTVLVCARPAAVAPALPVTVHAERPPLAKLVLWTALAACSSTLLLAATNEICQDVAVIPFLWVLPLALYLVSFIVTFEYERFYKRLVYFPGLALSLAAAVWALEQRAEAPLLPQLAAYLAVLFFGCMVCHGELVRQKPAPQHLTGFYLAISVGGACGGLFVGLAAPKLFTAFFELHLALLAVGGLAVLCLALDPSSPLRTGPRVLLARAAVGIGLFVLAGGIAAKAGIANEGALEARRSFYGLVKVTEGTEAGHRIRRLEHGRVCHGFQLLEPALHMTPVSYFGPGSGVDRALTLHPARAERPLRVGLIGLGSGIVAAYGRPGDWMRHYEINPDVIDLAAGAPGKPAWFSFLADSPAKNEVVFGDGRKALEDELRAGGSHRFDVLIVDAFSGDAIPAHLLTVEAVKLYLAHLAPGGILVVQMTNRVLDIRPVVWGIADELGLASRWVMRDRDGGVLWWSEWSLLAVEEETLRGPVSAGTFKRDPKVKPLVWTDQRSNLVEVMNW